MRPVEGREGDVARHVRSSSPVSSPIFTICETSGGKTGSSTSGCAIGTPWCTFARTSTSADSTTQFPAVWPAISSALMMSTPAATSVARVREKRAIVTLRTTFPIPAGAFSLKRSHTCRPVSVRFQRRKPQTAAPIPGKITNQ